MFFEKKRHPPPPCHFACKISWQFVIWTFSSSVLFHELFVNLFANFEITGILTYVNKICFANFVDFARLAHLPGLILQPSVASTTLTYKC
jgi:hypothetical protein